MNQEPALARPLSAKWLALALLFATALMLLSWPGAAQAQRAFAQRFITNAPGDIALVGNTLMTCSITTGGNAASCAAARGGGSGAVAPINNNYDMINVDVDADPTTFNSSTAQLNLPAGSSVLFAGLYWAANSNDPNRNTALFSTPGSAGYTSVTSSAANVGAVGVSYQAFQDVTALVRSGGNGTYGVANVQNILGSNNNAGWSLVVAYRNASLPARNLAVYDGYTRVSGASQVDVTVSGFLTPPFGAVSSKIGTVAYDGDRTSLEGSAGLQFGPSCAALSPVFNAVNPQNDYFNSTISDLGVNVTSRNPAYTNTLGHDIDRTAPNTPLSNNVSSACVRVASSGETIDLGVLTLATDVYVPQVTGNVTKTATDLNGGVVLPGDVIEYVINIANTGQDGAINFVLKDSVPVNTTYVPGSFAVLSGPNAGAKSDAAGDDQAEFSTSAAACAPQAAPCLVVRVGTGATAAAGGNLQPAASTSLRFRVTVNNVVPPGYVITNQADLNYNAQTLGYAVNDKSDGDASTAGDNPTLTPVARPVLALAKTHGGDFVPVTNGVYTLTPRNTGPIYAQGPITVTDVLPSGLAFVSATGTGWSCGVAAATVTCTSSTAIPAGATGNPISLTVLPGAAAVPAVTNSATLSGGGAAAPATADDPTNVKGSPQLAASKSAAKVAGSGGVTVVPGDTLEYTTTVTNSGNIAATAASFADPIPANTSYVAGSTTLNGAVRADSGGTMPFAGAGAPINGPSAAAGQIDLGAAAAAVVKFRVRVNTPFPISVSSVSNQGTVNASGPSGALPALPTDDPALAGASDPTVTPITANALFNVAKSFNLLKGSGNTLAGAQPGDRLQYVITVTNTGTTGGVSSSIVNDALPAGTSYVPGSTSLNGVPLPDAGGGSPYSQPGGAGIASPGASSGIVNVGAANAAVVRFSVLIDNPFPIGQTSVANTATASGNGPNGPTNASNPPAVAPVTASPTLAASKVAAKVAGSAGGAVQPGDTLEYSITLTNSGNTAATAASFSDAIPANTTYVAGSTSVNGAARADAGGAMPFAAAGPVGSPGAPAGQLNAGAASAAVVKFRVTVNNPFPSGVANVTNQGSLAASGPKGSLPAVPTDDPTVAGGSDPTTTPIVSSSALTTAKTVSLVKAPGNTLAGAQPGDRLNYRITVTNTGNTGALASSTVTDPLPDYTSYVAGSTTLNGNVVADVGAQSAFMQPGGSGVSSAGAAAGVLNPGAANAAVVAFSAVIANPYPIGAGAVVNTASASGNGPGGTVTGASPPVATPVTASPHLTASKAAAKVAGSAGVTVVPGDTIEYTVTLGNRGNTAATGATFTDAIPANTAYVAGSTTLNGAALPDAGGALPFVGGAAINSPGAAAGQLIASATVNAIVTFRVTVNNPFPVGVSSVVNQGSVGGSGPAGALPNLPTDDPAVAGSTDPTVTPIVANPVFSVAKTFSIVKAAGNTLTAAQPGDEIAYVITITNTGTVGGISSSIVTDPLPTYTAYKPASTTLNGNALADVGGASPYGQPGGATISSPGASGGVVNVGAANAAVIRYSVVIANPFPQGLNTVSNTATASGSGPTGPVSGSNPPAVTPVVAAPVLSASKVAVKVGGSAGASVTPGDTLEYTVTITNTGNTLATAAAFADAIPASTTYVAGSTSLNGAKLADATGAMPFATGAAIRSPGAAAGVVNVGATNAVVVRFRVRINTPVPVGVTTISNQGSVSASGPGGPLPAVPTDDPAVGSPADPTVTPLNASPLLAVAKSYTLVKAAGNTLAGAQPGDRLEYAITITNTGTTGAISTTIASDPAPANTTYVPASTTLNNAPVADVSGASAYSQPAGAVVNSAGAPAGQINVGTANAALVRFSVTINNPYPVGAPAVVNTASVSGTGPSGPVAGSSPPATTPVTAAPVLGAAKTALKVAGSAGSAVAPGDTLEYTVTITNSGNTPSTATSFIDAVPANTTYVAGSTTLNAAPVADASGMPFATGAPVQTTSAAAGQLNTGAAAAAVVKFRVTVNTPFPTGTASISNQGAVNGSGPGGALAPVATDDPTLGGASDPTVTPVVANPLFNVAKSFVVVKAPGNTGAVAQPGDRINYVITVTNTGSTGGILSSITSDPLPANTSYVPGSTTLNGAALADAGGAGPYSALGGAGIASPGAAGGVVNPGAANAAVIRYAVTINNPFPLGISNVVNTATASGTGPSGPVSGSNPPAVTPVAAAPLLGAAKSVAKVGGSASSTVLPGDTLEYTVVVTNIGSTPATASTFTDTVPANTSYVIASTTLNGASRADVAGTLPFATGGVINGVGAPSGQINPGAANAATVRFRVTVNNPFPTGVANVSNQGSVSASGPAGPLPAVPTDDPGLAGSNDPTVTPISANPLFNVTKTFSLVKAAGNTLAAAQPGDEIAYVISVTNTGTTGGISSSLVADPLPVNTAYKAGSTSLNGTPVVDVGGASAYGQGAGAPVGSPGAAPGLVNAGAANAAVIRYSVVIASPYPAGAGAVVNTATASGTGPGGPVAGSNPPVTTPVVSSPVLASTKTVAKVGGAPGTAAQSGDTLEYTITLRNTGNVGATDAQLADAIPVGTSYVPSSTTLNGAAVADVSGAMHYAVAAPIQSPGAAAGRLEVGSPAVLRFRVSVNSPLPVGQVSVSNQAILNASGPSGALPALPSSDPSVATPGSPTVVAVGRQSIGLAKALQTLVPVSPGVYDLRFAFVVKNYGTLPATNVQVADDLALAFPAPASFSIVSAPVCSAGLTCAALGSFTGNSVGTGTALLAGTDALPAGTAAYTIAFTVRVSTNGGPGPFNNSARVTTAATPGGPAIATDLSQNGTDPDPDGDGDPAGNDAPTTIFLTALALEKAVDRSVAEIGESVRYTLRVRNPGAVAVPGGTLRDALPAGFRYIANTARLVDAVGGATTVVADPAGAPGPSLVFTLPSVPANGTLTLQYRALLGVGSMEGDGTNRATAYIGSLASNEARAKVTVTGGVFSREACVVGKVYVDCNGNQVQDAEELGIPGVRLFLEDGSNVTTDAEGKYSICGLKPITHALKVDPITLPRGSRLVTSSSRNVGDANSLFLNLRAGELHRGDFIEGSCSIPVLEQVKARRSQGEISAPGTERKGGAQRKLTAKPPESANPPLAQPPPAAGSAPAR